MFKKKITDWLTDPEKEKKKQEKIHSVELDILMSRLNKKYRELGEATFLNWKRNSMINVHSVKLKKLLKEIKELLAEIKKMEM